MRSRMVLYGARPALACIVGARPDCCLARGAITLRSSCERGSAGDWIHAKALARLMRLDPARAYAELAHGCARQTPRSAAKRLAAGTARRQSLFRTVRAAWWDCRRCRT